MKKGIHFCYCQNPDYTIPSLIKLSAVAIVASFTDRGFHPNILVVF